MMIFAAVVSLAPGVAQAQHTLDPADPEGAALIAAFERNPGGGLRCDVRRLDTRLSFALRWHAGYRATFALSQLPESEAGLQVVFRVTSRRTGQQHYFGQSFHLPPGPRPKRQAGQIDGGFFLGEGEYDVDWMLADGEGRSCRDRWNVRLKPGARETEAAQSLEPGEVAPIVIEWSGTPREPKRRFRVAIVLHVAPLFPHSIRLTSFDQSFLTTMLTSVLEKTPFLESSVYAVSLEKQQAIFASDRLDAESFRDLLEAMEALELGTITIDQYTRPDGHVDVLAEILNREIGAEQPPDAIIFVGPNNGHTVKFPRERLEDGSRVPPLFYLHLDFYSWRSPWADTIERLTRSQGGKVFTIHDPQALVKALKEIEADLIRAGGLKPPAAEAFSRFSPAELPDPRGLAARVVPPPPLLWDDSVAPDPMLWILEEARQ